MPLRLLARAAPFLLGAVAFALWLRRRHGEPPALPERTPAPRPAPPPAEPPQAPAEPPRVDIVTVVDDLLGTVR